MSRAAIQANKEEAKRRGITVPDEEDAPKDGKAYRAKTSLMDNATERAALIYNEATQCAYLQKFDRAFVLFNQAAAMGCPTSIYSVGLMYKNGHGVQQSNAKAIEWYRKAVALDHPMAQMNLGQMLYVGGEGYQADPREGERLIKASAAQGQPEAVGIMAHIDDMHLRMQGQQAAANKANKAASAACKEAIANGNAAVAGNLKRVRDSRACDHCGARQMTGHENGFELLGQFMSGEMPAEKVTINFCKGCMVAKYCGRKCQKAAWATHKAECKAEQDRQRATKAAASKAVDVDGLD